MVRVGTGATPMGKPLIALPDDDLERRWHVVEAKLTAHQDRLADQGGPVAMNSASGRRVWVVRLVDVVEGRRVHKSIYVGGDDQPELLRRARLWLDRCRVRGRVAAEVAGHARLAAAACGIALGLRPRLVPRRQ
jgi:hypothetical protein